MTYPLPSAAPPSLSFVLIDSAHPLHRAELDLRWQTLRRPLGMPPGSEVSAHEANAWHLLALRPGGAGPAPAPVVVGCVLLRPAGDGVGRLFQMGVAEVLQGHGVGRELVRRLERLATRRGLREIVLHAREYAQGFYERLGYEVEGERFEEVGLPHRVMRRRLG